MSFVVVRLKRVGDGWGFRGREIQGLVFFGSCFPFSLELIDVGGLVAVKIV